MKKKIIIVSGDPNSINSEIIYKSWKKLNRSLKRRIYLISNYRLIKSQFKKLKYRTYLKKISNINEAINCDKLKIINIPLKFIHPFKVKHNSASTFIINSLDFAHKLASRNDVSGIINCPINKTMLKKKNIGVTEYLASKCKLKINSEVMLIRNKKLPVSPVTTHIDVKDISKKINKKLIINKVEQINLWFKKNMKKKPIIGILGLNPHNAELRKDSEDRKIIIPTIKSLKKKVLKYMVLL